MSSAPAIPAAEIYTWRSGSGLRPERPDQPAPAALLVADSWLVLDGQSRGLESHRSRFTRACTAAGGVAPLDVGGYWQAMLAVMPRTGAWFPRLELVSGEGGRRLRLQVRPAPARQSDVTVLARRGDPRRFPRRKGPDLGLLAELGRRAADAGAGEALLTTRSGIVLEGTRSGLLWWENDTLCVVDPALRRLRSVTVELIVRAATARGITVAPRRRRVADLAGREVWLVNALHGIRPVSAWVGSTIEPGAASRAEYWREWWEGAAVSLPDSRHFEIAAS